MYKAKELPPRHVAIIMDGNGRWATQRGKPRHEGHLAGTKHLKSIITRLFEGGIYHLSLYGFSTENWSRPRSEIRGIFSLLTKSIDRELIGISKMRLRLLHLGSKKNLPTSVTKALDKMEKHTNFPDPKGTIALAFNYGSRSEILEATKNLVTHNVASGNIDEPLVSDHLHTKGLPNVDLLIRTGGEKRLSNFLLWQSVNAKFVSTETLWPDFTEQHVESILKSYNQY